MIRLETFVRPELALTCPEGCTQEQLFRLVADRLYENGIITDREALVRELLAREQLGSTGVGNGIALPHALVPSASSAAVATVRLSTPLDWAAADREPVRTAFVIVGPTDERKLYLEILAELARSLNQSEIRAAALRTTNPVRVAEIVSSPPHQSFIRRNRRMLVFLLVVAAAYVAARLTLPLIRLPNVGFYAAPEYLKFNMQPWLARQELTVALFVAMVLGTLLFWRFRVAIAAASLGVLLVAGVMNLETTVDFMSIPTILFIMAMMVIVRWLENIGVFRFVVVKAVEQVKGIPWLLLLILMGFSVLMGGFADEVSAILVTFGLALEVSRRTKAPLVPYLLSLVFATNVGSALTLVGNPIGVYIAFAGNLTFEDFLRWATPVSALAAVIVALLCLLLFRKHFFGRRYEFDARELEQSIGIVDPAKLRTGIITFAVTVVMIALHRRIEVLLGLGDGTALVAVALMVTGFIVFHEQERGKLLIERGIDWWTLLFFMFLFANAACLEYTGVTTKLGYLLHTLSGNISAALGGRVGVAGSASVLMLWASSLLSGFVDNLPIVAALVPIARDMGPAGINIPHASILWWALLFGGCFGGNLTVIGSTANLVAVGAFERTTGQHVKFGEWFRVGIVVTAVSLAVATAALLIQTKIAP
ncbi:MAG: SLC13 family permease [candidate division WOR-3 bacterium]